MTLGGDGTAAVVVAVWSDRFRTWPLASCSMIAWKGTQNASKMRVGRERLLHGFHCSSGRWKWESVSCLSSSGCGASNLLRSDTTSEGFGKGLKQVQSAKVAGAEGVPASAVSISTVPLSSSSL